MLLYDSKTAGSQDALFAVIEEWIIEDERLYLLRVLSAHRTPFKGQLNQNEKQSMETETKENESELKMNINPQSE